LGEKYVFVKENEAFCLEYCGVFIIFVESSKLIIIIIIIIIIVQRN